MKKTLLTTILIILSVLCFEQETRSIAMSNYFFVSSGNWNDGSHWNTGEVPPEGSDVFIAADAVIPAGYTAIANQISLLGGRITVADGGQLKHNTQGLVVTMEKSIAAFNEVNSWSNYYLLAFPFSEDVAVPSTMTANEDNDFYTFDSNYPNAEWRNNKQHVIATVGGTTGYLYANPEAIELSLTGSTYQSYDEASITVEVTYSEDSNNTFNGWALLGNPYTCNAYIYALENGSCVPKEFMVYDADGELVRCLCSSVAPMQGFFVKVDETTTICIKTTSPYVDLGLPSGTLWAACNVGAVTPEDYGDYFAWGETQPKDFYDWSTYQYCNGSYNTLTKYCSDASFGYNGFSDTLSILLRENDAATANWGSDWRMPTNEEWQELYNNTTHVWTTQNGVNGRLFTSENGNSLFLPAGGIYSNGSLGSTGSGCYYWSSSLSTESPNLSWQCSFYSNGYNSYEFARFFGISVRPVRYTVPPSSYIIDAIANPAEGGEISGSGIFQEGAECTLIATANEGYTFTNWTENDELVSTDANYTFTVTADRNLVANFTSSGSSDHDYVDLGLPSGLLWATCNIGADSPEEYGDYFAWSETQPKDTYDWETYQYCMGSGNTLNKYCNNASYGYYGFTDNLTVLEASDDAATAQWGSGWRMPTKEEWQEIYQNTTHVWTTQNGVNGRLFTATNGNNLFLPAAGYHDSSNLYNTGSDGLYWSSSLYTDSPYRAWYLSFLSGYSGIYNYLSRCKGLSVRAVRSAQPGTTDCTITVTSNPAEGGSVTGGGTYQQGQSCTVTATANTDYSFTYWTENDEIVSVEATYSFIVIGNRNFVANFIYEGGSSTHDYVDLGLPSGILWATCNIGASSPEEYGDYFAWGETQPKDYYDWSTYLHCNGDINTFTKYCTNSDYGYNNFIDNLTTLLPEDDVATANWGNDWRMPTWEECQELLENTTKTWTTQNGTNGWRFTASNGNSLFFPAAGFCWLDLPQGVGTYGGYWSGSLENSEIPNLALELFFSSGYCNTSSDNRCNGLSVRAVHSSQSGTTDYTITLMPSPTEGGTVTGGGIYQQGQSCTVTATANAGYTFANWTENGIVASNDSSYSFIVSGNRTLVANFTYSSGSNHDYVDLGLPSGLLWATRNVGADTPEDYGDYFAWGETQPKDTYDWSNYQYSNGGYFNNDVFIPYLTKYCNNSNYGYNGFTDNLTTLLPEDDAATANWGNDWRMPTKEEWDELWDNTTHTWTIQNGVNGTLFIASNGNSLFLPAAGYCTTSSSPYSAGTYGYYWSSSLYTSNPSKAWTCYFSSYGCNVYYDFYRDDGQSVRAVRSMQPGNTYSIIVSASPAYGGTVSGGGTYQQGQSCTVSATAASGYAFTNWTENGSVVSTNASYTFTVNSNRTLVAYFSAQAPNTYTISVSSNPTNGGWVTGGGTYQQGQSCTVSASANTGYTFLRWTENGTQVSTNASYTFTVTGNRTLVAQFQAQGYTINVSANPTNGGSVTGGGSYNYGQSCTVTATAASGYTFLRWTENGTQVSTNSNYTFTVTNNRTIVAQFQSNAAIPTVTTAQVTNITPSTAVGGGNVTSSGGTTVTERGVCWSTSHNPTTSGSHASNDTGTGSFTVSMTGLTANTTYYVRAYAINSVGTAYGSEVSFTTLNNGGNNHEYVDLGLPSGLLWATCNVGANSPEGYGYYFSWGETMTKSNYTWSTYQYCMGSDHTLTKYCSNATYGHNGFTDNLTTLLSEDDAVVANWAGNWRMPTQAEWQELLDNTTSIWTTQNGINGRLFTASNGNTLFLPDAGAYSSIGFLGGGSYWSSSLNTDTPNCARGLGFNSEVCGMSNASRDIGKPVRAVKPGPNIYYVTVLPSSVSGGTVIGGGTYQQGQSCTVSATANSGYSFTNWTENGNIVSTNASYTFTVTGNRTLVAKFTLDQPPTGVINGLFTINANGDQVFFSQGNLQYRASTGTWRFAPNQYDYIGSANSDISQTNNGWIDLYGWGTSGWPTGANRLYQPWQTGSASLFGPPGENDLTGSYANSDWGVYNAISNGGNTTNTWRTLTGGSDGEWKYIFESRSTASGIRYAKAQVNGVRGVILLPDDWNESFYPLYNTNMADASWYGNNISVSQWPTLEQYGAVFLPAAGYRDGTSFYIGYNNIITGYYWSSTCSGTNGAKSFAIDTYSIYYHENSSPYRNRGYSVRLVQDY